MMVGLSWTSWTDCTSELEWVELLLVLSDTNQVKKNRICQLNPHYPVSRTQTLKALHAFLSLGTFRCNCESCVFSRISSFVKLESKNLCSLNATSLLCSASRASRSANPRGFCVVHWGQMTAIAWSVRFRMSVRARGGVSRCREAVQLFGCWCWEGGETHCGHCVLHPRACWLFWRSLLCWKLSKSPACASEASLQHAEQNHIFALCQHHRNDLTSLLSTPVMRMWFSWALPSVGSMPGVLILETKGIWILSWSEPVLLHRACIAPPTSCFPAPARAGVYAAGSWVGLG